MICPLAPTHNGSSNYIDQTCYIPITDDSQLQNYFTHTVLRDTVHGVFVIRTSKTIISLKENGHVQDFLSKNTISLSQTNWLTEKKKDVFFDSRLKVVTPRQYFRGSMDKGNILFSPLANSFVIAISRFSIGSPARDRFLLGI